MVLAYTPRSVTTDLGIRLAQTVRFLCYFLFHPADPPPLNAGLVWVIAPLLRGTGPPVLLALLFFVLPIPIARSQGQFGYSDTHTLTPDFVTF